MTIPTDTPFAGPAGNAPPVVSLGDEADVDRWAGTFAVSPDAVRRAVAGVGSDFRAVQRELGGRR